MKCLVIVDLFINVVMMELGLKVFRDNGIEVEVCEWLYDFVEKFQEDNLWVEQEGVEVVVLLEVLFQGMDDIDILIIQFVLVNIVVFDKLLKLKYVGVFCGGVENVNFQVVNVWGVEVMNILGCNVCSVVEFMVGMILVEMCNIVCLYDVLCDKYWCKDSLNYQVILEFGGKVVGLVGFGYIV